MGLQHAVDLRASDVLAAAPDDVLLARDEEVAAVLVARDQISGHEPAVAKRGAGLLRIAEVAEHGDRVLDPEFPHFSRARLVAVVVHHPALGPLALRIGMAADRPHASRLAWTIEGVAAHAGNLGHAEAAQEMRYPEFVAERRDDVCEHAVDLGDPVLGTELRARPPRQDAADRLDDVDLRRAVLDGHIPEIGG